MKDIMDIEKLTKATHTPRGEYAATEDNYERLKMRLEDKPRLGTSSGKRRHTLWQKLAIAASILVVSSIGFAMIKEYVIDAGKGIETLNYKSAALKDIVEDLESVYGVEISVEDTSKLNYRVTAEYDTDEMLEDVLNSLSAASGTVIRVEK